MTEEGDEPGHDKLLYRNERDKPGRYITPAHLRDAAVLAEHGVACRCRHLGDGDERSVAVRRVIAAAEVIGARGRIGADDE